MRQEIVVGVSLVLAIVGGAGVVAQPAGGKHVRASLVAETAAVRAGQPLLVGFRLEMEPGWHTYWSNPGDSGLPTRARWELPEGFSAGELQWPRPIRFATGPLVSYGYEHEVLHPVEIQVPASLPGGDVRLAARLSWLECSDVCLPGKAELTLTLPARGEAGPGPAAPLFTEARRQMPHEDAGWTLAASAREGAIDLALQPPPGTTLGEAYFYPLSRRVLDYSKPQTLTAEKKGYRLELVRDPNGEPFVERLAGVLVARTPAGEKAVAVDVPVSRQEEGRP
jgi:DsbC/DsbD-like thiol-disulfide interchange protein